MKLVSAVFHPLLMATYCCLIFYGVVPAIFSPIAPQSIMPFVGVVFVTTFVVPLVSILFMRLSRQITSLEMTDRQERIFPFLSIFSFYAITTYLFYARMSISWSILVTIALVTLLILIIFLISLRFKVSVHATAVWGMVGLYVSVVLKYPHEYASGVIVGLLLIAGLTSSSRLYLGRHSEREVWVGALLGFFFCLIGFLFFG